MSVARIVKLVSNRLREAGVKRRRAGNDSKVTRKALLAALKTARTWEEAAKLMGFAMGRSARQRARALGIHWESEGNLARYRHLAVDLYRRGKSLSEIAAVVGRNSNAVYGVLKRLGEIDPERANPYHFSKRLKQGEKPVSSTAARWSKVSGRRRRDHADRFPNE